MVETTEGLDMEFEQVVADEYEGKMKVVYPRTEKELIDFLNRCKS